MNGDVNPTLGPMATAAMDLLVEAVAQIPAGCWDQPSNLDGWSIRDLVGHATGSAAKVVTLLEGKAVWQGPSRPADWHSDDPTARLADLAARLPAALARADLDATRPSPEGEVPLHRALAYPVADLALHSWDLHRSQGRLIELLQDVLAFCRALVESVPDDLLRRPGGFGPAQPVPDDATPTARLMAHLGRSVAVRAR